MKRSVVFFCVLLAAGALQARAQVAPAASARQFSVTVGGMGSLFQPDYAERGAPQTSPNRLGGLGAYVDLKFTRWIQVEGEGRWLRFNQYANIYQDNYLIGPRVPIHRFWRATPYAKVLAGFAEMNFEYNDAHGRFTDIAYGGGVDVQLTRRITVRAFDVEYQQWPDWLGTTLSPYGASAGVSYRVFGGR